MKVKNTIFAWLKVFTCLSFAVALVFSAPSASHAASGMHGQSHAMAADSGPKVDDHTHQQMSLMTQHDGSAVTSKVADEKQSYGDCCSGICISVALSYTDAVFVEQTPTEVYLILHGQMNSIDSSSFLRPPQYLI